MTSIDIGGRELPFPDFLRYCATGQAPRGLTAEFCQIDLERARNVFVQAGLTALEAAPAGARWIQIGIEPATAGRRELYQRLQAFVRQQLSNSALSNFFFLRKNPGLRLRFQPASESAGLPDILDREVADWQECGLVNRVSAGVYEPESAIFGGPISMSYVHALFTVDSVTWLGYHADPPPDEQAVTCAWAVSLTMLRTLFDGLGIVSLEDIGVWDHVRTRARRWLPAEILSGQAYREIAEPIRVIWSRPDQVFDQLPASTRTVVTGQQQALRDGAARWREGYFGTRAAYLGPRAAAAYYVVFHWNRAALSSAQQALLAESLADRPV